MPDLEIFDTIEYDRSILETRFREMAFLTKGLAIDFEDQRGEGFKTSFKYDGGIVDFVTYLHSQGTRDPIQKKVVYMEESGDVGEVEVALQWNNSLPGEPALVRQQHQHPRGRRAPLGVPVRAHAHVERVRAAEGLHQGEG